MRRSVLSLAFLLLAGAPAIAECADPILPLEIAKPSVEAAWRGLQQRRSFPWGEAQVWSKIDGDRIELALPFERLSANHKRMALDMLGLGGLPATLYLPDAFDRLTQNRPMTPYTVFAHDGRVVSIPYDGCTRLYMFTELDRARLRWKGRTPPARKVRYPLAEPILHDVTTNFWRIVGKSQPDILHLAWVPERGHFEITVAMEARLRYRNRIAPFWWQAPMDLHYVVLDANGDWLEERGMLPPPFYYNQ